MEGKFIDLFDLVSVTTWIEQGFFCKIKEKEGFKGKQIIILRSVPQKIKNMPDDGNVHFLKIP